MALVGAWIDGRQARPRPELTEAQWSTSLACLGCVACEAGQLEDETREFARRLGVFEGLRQAGQEILGPAVWDERLRFHCASKVEREFMADGGRARRAAAVGLGLGASFVPLDSSEAFEAFNRRSQEPALFALGRPLGLDGAQALAFMNRRLEIARELGRQLRALRVSRHLVNESLAAARQTEGFIQADLPRWDAWLQARALREASFLPDSVKASPRRI